MKKIALIVLSIIVLMLFASCAAAPSDYYADFKHPLVYDIDSLRYDHLNDSDIYNYVRDDYLDLIAILPNTTQFTNIDSSWEQVVDLIKKLSLIGYELNIAPLTMMEKTSSEINSLAASASITLTVDDIVAFNDLKSYLNELDGLVSVKKEDLFSVHLDRPLTKEEIDSLSTLQHYYNQLMQESNFVSLKTMSYEDLEPLLLSLMTPPGEEDLLEFETGLQLLQSIIK